jgi:hypothetical protein
LVAEAGDKRKRAKGKSKKAKVKKKSRFLIFTFSFYLFTFTFLEYYAFLVGCDLPLAVADRFNRTNSSKLLPLPAGGLLP